MQAVRTRSTPLALGRQSVWPSGQALLCISVFALACSAAFLAWRTSPPGISFPLGVALLAVSLPVAANVSLRVGQGVRLYFTGASILFIVALLPPPLAMAIVGAGMLAKELSVCRRCGNMAWQVLGQVGRWMVIALCASAIVHATNVLAASAIIGGVLWAGDVLTAPLVLRTGSPLPALYRTLVERTWVDELMQYMTGALLLPVVVLQRQDPVFVAASIAVVGLWLLMVYIMHDPSDRRLP